jgi:hypothetical protein
MENINGKGRPRWMLLCLTMCLPLSLSPCFAQGNREAQLVTTPPEITPFACDSLDPRVCFDIYQRHMERIPAPTRSDDQGDNGVLAIARRLERCLSTPNQFGMLTPQRWLAPPMRSDYCSSITNIR